MDRIRVSSSRAESEVISYGLELDFGVALELMV